MDALTIRCSPANRSGQHDRLAPVGADRDGPDGDAQLLADELDVSPRRSREVVPLSDLIDRFGPAWEGPVDRAAAFEVGQGGGQIVDPSAVAFVGDRDVQLVD